MSINNAGAVAKTVANLVKSIPVRNKDVVSRRFGLKNGKKETLESIGKGYGITRERVRQIEEFAVNQLRKIADGNQNVERYVALAKNIIGNDGVMKERDLFKAFSGSEADSAVNSSLVFVLSLSKDLVRVGDNEDFNAFWAVSSGALNDFKNLASEFVSFLEKSGKPVSENDFTPLAGKTDTFLSISKAVSKNIFNEVGLVSWPEIKPKGVRDKAYLVLKKNNSPKHFGEIAKLINTSGFNGKKANTQTVHNELIKDGRFILVGRGTYALSEWGYKAGTVKDVLVDLLKGSSKPIQKATLVSKVLNSRMVKENTILLNLQDPKVFIRNEDGTYSLRKA
ncbi:MAG: hypothetical protein HYT66_01350 [Candidatus Yanofskybacteria bacterium]|nr:hypothetical protein [Candidatus Yanofskybacteria bacterium]